MADFKVQRRTIQLSPTQGSNTAAIDPVASLERAFVLPNSNLWVGSGPPTDEDAVTLQDMCAAAYLSAVGTLTANRHLSSTPTLPVEISAEVIEYTGPTGGSNEFKSRQVDFLEFVGTTITANGPLITNIQDISRCTIHPLGLRSDSAFQAWDRSFGTLDFIPSGSGWRVQCQKNDVTSSGRYIWFQVVEWTGSDNDVQKVIHGFTGAGQAEPEILQRSVGNIANAFVFETFRTAEPKPAGCSCLAYFQPDDPLNLYFELSGEHPDPNNADAIAFVVKNPNFTVFHYQGAYPDGLSRAAPYDFPIYPVDDVANTFCRLQAVADTSRTVAVNPVQLVNGELQADGQSYLMSRSNASGDIPGKFTLQIIQGPSIGYVDGGGVATAVAQASMSPQAVIPGGGVATAVATASMQSQGVIDGGGEATAEATAVMTDAFGALPGETIGGVATAVASASMGAQAVIDGGGVASAEATASMRAEAVVNGGGVATAVATALFDNSFRAPSILTRVYFRDIRTVVRL